MSKEHPILFNAPMVRAILDGTKTQTRRIVKPQPGGANRIPVIGRKNVVVNIRDLRAAEFGSPYQPGDRLWVRETWAHVPASAYRCSDGVQQTICPTDKDMAAVYAAGWDRSSPGRWRPSIHMPRWASRIILEITAVRVERLKEIHEVDAKAEGITSRWITKPWGQELGWQADWSSVGRPSKFALNGITTESDICLGTARHAFWNLWESVYGLGSWEANPWVWVVEFKRVEVPHA